MKRFTLLTILTVMLVCGIYAQVQKQATVMDISIPDSGSDPYLCVFGNTINDVSMLDYHFDLNGKEILFLRQRAEERPHQVFTREMERLNVRFLSLHIYQRRLVEVNGQMNIVGYFIVRIIEREGNRYYYIGGNDYDL